MEQQEQIPLNLVQAIRGSHAPCLTLVLCGTFPPSADVVCESSPINLLSPAGHSPSLLSAVPFQLLSEGVTMSLDISTEGQSVPLHGSSVLFHVLNFLTEGGMCL